MHRLTSAVDSGALLSAGVVPMSPTVIRVSEARELLAYVPYRLGFRPRESLVAVSLRAPRGRLGLVVRVDLADLVATPTGSELAGALTRHLEGDGARRVVLVVYSETPREDLRAGHGPAGLALARMREALGPDLVADTWVVGTQGYAGVECQDEGCCPATGRPLAELESTEVGAHMVLAGASVVDSRDDLGFRGSAPAPARHAAARAASAERSRLREARSAAERTGRVDPLLGWAERSMALWADLRRRAHGGQHLPAAALGRLLVALEDVGLRDEMLLRLVDEGAPQAGIGSRAALEAVFTPGGVAPDESVVADARRVLEALASHAPARRVAPVLAVLAWLAWWEGDGARAGVLTVQCLAADPDHRLARLLDEALGRGLAPGWARVAGDAAQDGPSGPRDDPAPGWEAGGRWQGGWDEDGWDEDGADGRRAVG